jgi:hypothetical protein
MTDEVRYDAANRAIRIGDTVAATVSNYSWMEVYKVVGFTPKNVRVSNGKETFLRGFSQLVRIDYTPEDLANVIKKG